jgi:hypothetical protein
LRSATRDLQNAATCRAIADAVSVSIMIRAVVRSLFVVCVLAGVGLADPAPAAPAAATAPAVPAAAAAPKAAHHHKHRVKKARKAKHHKHHHKAPAASPQPH